jgi:hypothetical protein
MTVSERCSDISREHAEPLLATASAARRWLLVEHPGPWAPKALDSPEIAPARKALKAAAVPGVGKILLMRRPGRHARGGRRRWMVLDHEAGWTAAGTWDPDAAPHGPDAGLLAAAEALADDTATATTQPSDPMLLVCAHGRHDLCCAVRGRPVAAALAQRWPEQTWECSHLGGHRFSANLAVVPDGVYYGRLDPTTAVSVVEAHLAGRVDAEHLRGFTWHPPVVQAAMTAAHRRWGPAGPRALAVTSVTGAGEDRWSVELAGAAGLPARVSATVTRSLRPPALLSCRADAEAVAAAFEVTDLVAAAKIA